IFTSAGIEPGYRVAMALPNGLETIVCFLAASIAGTAAPLNAAYRHDEFAFYLEDTDAKLLILPPDGADEARRAAAEKNVPITVPEKFNPLSFWRTVRDYHPTWYSAVPTMHRLLLARAGDHRPAGAEHLRFIRSASAPLSLHTMQKLEHVFGTPVLEAYGMTEASHQIASNPLPPAARRADPVGLGTGVRISIMDTHGHHSHLGMGHAGEVVIQGPSIIDGYESNPEANATSFVDGWFRTGDQGIIDPDGYLRLLARLKDLINRGGEKIAPMEIGQVLLKHPAVAEAVCFGVPHPTW